MGRLFLLRPVTFDQPVKFGHLLLAIRDSFGGGVHVAGSGSQSCPVCKGQEFAVEGLSAPSIAEQSSPASPLSSLPCGALSHMTGILPSSEHRLRNAAGEIDEGALAAAAWPYQRDELAVGDGKAQILERRERLFAIADPFNCALPSERDQAIGFWSATRSIATGTRREMSRVDVSYPFLHRPLVEFMQAIPHTQRLRVGETRSLMRRSLRGLLPAKTLKRRSKGNPQEVITRAIAREWPRFEPSRKTRRCSSSAAFSHTWITRSSAPKGSTASTI